MQDIIISFIIPLYNSVKYIKECLDSIERQGISKDHYEIIVVDDGSTDGGGDVAMSYENVVYFRQNNQGQSVARNKGIEVAKGKYLCFIDSDDILIENSMTHIWDLVLTRDVDVVTYSMIICSDTEVHKLSAQKTFTISPVMSGYEYIEQFNFNNGPCWYILRKDILKGLRFECGRYAEDGMFTMNLLMRANSIIHTDNQSMLLLRKKTILNNH